ncbi:hypothetical protein [Paludibaculum fermentans]|uniref:hypothetical protein n=1 Tax=Paludibaculum fermentans TaxID=1473598 RepID=UPI003EBA5099
MRIVLIVTLAAVAGVFIWLVGLRLLSGLLDRLSTNRVAVQPVHQLRFDNGVLEMAGKRLDLLIPGSLPSGFTVSLSSSGRVSFAYQGQQFPCGPGRQQGGPDALPDFEFTPDSGDAVTFTTEQSRLSWPTPLEMNFMTGSAPSWRRHLYHRLAWTKRSGANVEILWRFQQGFFPADGWRPPTVESGFAGFSRMSILEAKDLRAAASEHVARTKGWKEGEFRLEDRGPAADGSGEVMAVIHRDDETAQHPGSGRSLGLVLDYKSRRVAREIAFQ